MTCKHSILLFTILLSCLYAFAQPADFPNPPTSNNHRKASPDCLIPAVISMLLSFKDANVDVITASSEDYGLDNRDYLFPTSADNKLRFDQNHTNFNGAKKVTNQVGIYLAPVYKNLSAKESSR